MGNICEALNCAFYQPRTDDDDFLEMRKLFSFICIEI